MWDYWHMNSIGFSTLHLLVTNHSVLFRLYTRSLLRGRMLNCHLLLASSLNFKICVLLLFIHIKIFFVSVPLSKIPMMFSWSRHLRTKWTNYAVYPGNWIISANTLSEREKIAGFVSILKSIKTCTVRGSSIRCFLCSLVPFSG